MRLKKKKTSIREYLVIEKLGLSQIKLIIYSPKSLRSLFFNLKYTNKITILMSSFH